MSKLTKVYETNIVNEQNSIHINKGGTSSRDSKSFSKKIDGIHTSELNKPLGVATLDNDLKIRSENIPLALRSDDITIYGDKTIYNVVNNYYYISNFSYGKTYTITASGATLNTSNLSNGYFYLTTNLSSGTCSFTINGRTVNLNISTLTYKKPSIVNISNNQTNVNPNSLIIKGSEPYCDNNVAYYNYLKCIINVTNKLTNVTNTYTINNQNTYTVTLDYYTDYSVTIKYDALNTLASSVVSDVINFKTKAPTTIVPCKPTLTKSSIDPTPITGFIISGSEYKIRPSDRNNQILSFTDFPDTHHSTDWYLYSDSTYETLITSSVNDTVNKTSWNVPELDYDNTYYVKAKYNGTLYSNNGDYGYTSFTTKEPDDVHVIKPIITSPLNDTYGNSYTNLNINASAFSVSWRTDTHLSTDWQISTLEDFSTLVINSTDNTTNKTSINITSLEEFTTYYIRVRYKGTNRGYSEWSDIIKIKTDVPAGTNITKPSITSPITNIVDYSLTGIVSSSAFTCSYTDHGFEDEHINSIWQIDNTSSFTNPVGYLSNTDLTSISLSVFNVNYYKTFYIRVKHTGKLLGASEWSEPICIRTITPTIDNISLSNPIITYPTSGSTNVSNNNLVFSTALPSVSSYVDNGVRLYVKTATIEYDTLEDFSTKTDITDTPNEVLSAYTYTINTLDYFIDYYIRVKFLVTVQYKDNDNNWVNVGDITTSYSDIIDFQTKEPDYVYVIPPTITSPKQYQKYDSAPVTLNCSSFAVSWGTDTLSSTDWNIATNSTFTENLITVTDSTTSLSTSYVLTTLIPGKIYYVKVRHTGNRRGISAWSNIIKFSVSLSNEEDYSLPTLFTYPNYDSVGLKPIVCMSLLDNNELNTTDGFEYTIQYDTDSNFSDPISADVNTIPDFTGKHTTDIYDDPKIVVYSELELSANTTYYVRGRCVGSSLSTVPTYQDDWSDTLIINSGKGIGDYLNVLWINIPDKYTCKTPLGCRVFANIRYPNGLSPSNVELSLCNDNRLYQSSINTFLLLTKDDLTVDENGYVDFSPNINNYFYSNEFNFKNSLILFPYYNSLSQQYISTTSYTLSSNTGTYFSVSTEDTDIDDLFKIADGDDSTYFLTNNGSEYSYITYTSKNDYTLDIRDISFITKAGSNSEDTTLTGARYIKIDKYNPTTGEYTNIGEYAITANGNLSNYGFDGVTCKQFRIGIKGESTWTSGIQINTIKLTLVDSTNYYNYYKTTSLSRNKYVNKFRYLQTINFTDALSDIGSRIRMDNKGDRIVYCNLNHRNTDNHITIEIYKIIEDVYTLETTIIPYDDIPSVSTTYVTELRLTENADKLFVSFNNNASKGIHIYSRVGNYWSYDGIIEIDNYTYSHSFSINSDGTKLVFGFSSKLLIYFLEEVEGVDTWVLKSNNTNITFTTLQGISMSGMGNRICVSNSSTNTITNKFFNISNTGTLSTGPVINTVDNLGGNYSFNTNGIFNYDGTRYISTFPRRGYLDYIFLNSNASYDVMNINIKNSFAAYYYPSNDCSICGDANLERLYIYSFGDLAILKIDAINKNFSIENIECINENRGSTNYGYPVVSKDNNRLVLLTSKKIHSFKNKYNIYNTTSNIDMVSNNLSGAICTSSEGDELISGKGNDDSILAYILKYVNESWVPNTTLSIIDIPGTTHIVKQVCINDDNNKLAITLIDTSISSEYSCMLYTFIKENNVWTSKYKTPNTNNLISYIDISSDGSKIAVQYTTSYVIDILEFNYLENDYRHRFYINTDTSAYIKPEGIVDYLKFNNISDKLFIKYKHDTGYNYLTNSKNYCLIADLSNTSPIVVNRYFSINETDVYKLPYEVIIDNDFTTLIYINYVSLNNVKYNKLYVANINGNSLNIVQETILPDEYTNKDLKLSLSKDDSTLLVTRPNHLSTMVPYMYSENDDDLMYSSDDNSLMYN